MNYKITIFLLGFLLCSYLIYSQGNEELSVQPILENILETAPDNIDYSEIQDQLLYYYHHPIQLNTTTKQELSKLLFLSPVQINNIIEYRKKYSGFKSIYELKTIPSLDDNTIQKLLVFVKVDQGLSDSTLSFKKLLFSGSNTLLLKYKQTLENEKGYDQTLSNHFLGSPQYYYTRFEHNYSDKLDYGLTAEKQPGEQFFKGSEKDGFDFYSAHFYIGGMKHIQHLVIGDYQACFGQGLVFFSGFNYSKTPYVLNIYKSPEELSPYRSTNQSNYLRGIGITYKFSNIRITLFYSYKKIDGKIVSPDSTNLYTTTFFPESYSAGLHRTPSEISIKNTVSEQISGGHISYSYQNFKIGITSAAGIYNPSMALRTKLYDQYDFRGNSFLNYGTDLTYSLKKYLFFTEFGSDGNTVANISGIVVNINSMLDMALLYRNYPKDYHALYANAFRTSTNTQNEKGLYLSLSFVPSPKYSFNVYIDQFTFPWLNYQVDAPSKGYDWLLDFNYIYSKSIHFNIRLKQFMKSLNSSDNNSQTNQINDTKRTGVRMELIYSISHHISLKNRVEYSNYRSVNISSYDGLLLNQDVIYSTTNNKLQFILRYAVFNVDDFYSRIYDYEAELTNSFSIPYFYNKGARYYIYASYKINKHFNLIVKLAQTKYFNISTISSGLTEIDSNHKTDLGLMLKYIF